MGLIDRLRAVRGASPRVTTGAPAVAADVQPAVTSGTGDAFARTDAIVEAVRRTYAEQIAQAFNAGLEITGRSRINRYGGQAFSRHATLYSCMSLIMQDMAALTYRLYEPQPDGTKGDEVPSHPLLDLLKEPNPDHYSDFAQFLEMWVGFLLGSGNAFLYVDPKVNSKTKLPIALTIYPLGTVTPRIDTVRGLLTAWNFKWGSRSGNVAVETFQHMKLTNIDDGYQILGVGPLQVAQAIIDSDFARQRYEEAFFINGAIPSAYLKYDPGANPKLPPMLGKDRLDASLDAFKDSHQGADKMQGLAALDAGWTFNAIGISQRDMQFIEMRLNTVTEVARVFHVPPALLADYRDQGLSRAGVETADMIYARRVLVPLARRLSSFFQRALVNRFAPGLIGEFDIDEIEGLHEGFDGKVTNFVKLVGAYVSPKQANEVVDLGLDPDQLCDEPLVPFSIAPLSEVVAGHAAPEPTATPETPAAPETPVEAPNAEKPADETPSKPRMRNGGATYVPLSVAQRLLGLRDEAPKSMDPRERAWRAFDRKVTPLVTRFERRVKRYFNALRAEVLANLERVLGRGTRGIDDDITKILFDQGEADSELRDFSEAYFEKAIGLGVDGIAEHLGVEPIGLDSPTTQAFFRTKVNYVVGINDTVRDALVDTLNEGFDAGEALAALRARINDVFDAGVTRANTIARTEIASAVNGGRHNEMEAQGIEKKEWLSSKDDHVRDSHADLDDGTAIPLDEPYDNGLMFPGDPDGPPEEVCNCRCTEIPVVEQE